VLFEIEAKQRETLPGHKEAARCALTYCIALERYRRISKDSNASSADVEACLSQLNEIQQGMDGIWQEFIRRLAKLRKRAGAAPKQSEPAGMFDTKGKQRRNPNRATLTPRSQSAPFREPTTPDYW